MTTLREGRLMLLAQYTPENCPDQEFAKKMKDQVIAMTTKENPYYVWETLSDEEKLQYGSVENHLAGTELCLERWNKTNADEKWGDEYK